MEPRSSSGFAVRASGRLRTAIVIDAERTSALGRTARRVFRSEVATQGPTPYDVGFADLPVFEGMDGPGPLLWDTIDLVAALGRREIRQRIVQDLFLHRKGREEDTMAETVEFKDVLAVLGRPRSSREGEPRPCAVWHNPTCFLKFRTFDANRSDLSKLRNLYHEALALGLLTYLRRFAPRSAALFIPTFYYFVEMKSSNSLSIFNDYVLATQALKPRTKTPVDQAHDALIRLCLGCTLVAAESVGLAHNDVKEDNVMYAPQPLERALLFDIVVKDRITRVKLPQGMYVPYLVDWDLVQSHPFFDNYSQGLGEIIDLYKKETEAVGEEPTKESGLAHLLEDVPREYLVRYDSAVVADLRVEPLRPWDDFVPHRAERRPLSISTQEDPVPSLRDEAFPWIAERMSAPKLMFPL